MPLYLHKSDSFLEVLCLKSLCFLLLQLTSTNVTVLEACAASSAVCLALMFLYKMSLGRLPSLVPKATRTGVLVALRACCGACTMLCFYTAVSLAGVRDATALVGSYGIGVLDHLSLTKILTEHPRFQDFSLCVRGLL
jgi:drug/metabolite transporter (DMT)-like permease